MDGWETRRKRIKGHDFVIIGLNQPYFVKAICVDTAFFTGNHAPRFSIQAELLERSIEDEVKHSYNKSNDFNGMIQNRKNKLGTAASFEEFQRIDRIKTEVSFILCAYCIRNYCFIFQFYLLVHYIIAIMIKS